MFKYLSVTKIKINIVVLLNNSRATDFSVVVKACDWGELLHEISDGIAVRPGLISTVWGHMIMPCLGLGLVKACQERPEVVGALLSI